MTLWPIDDEQTAGFMADFYLAAQRLEDPSRALAAVQRDWLARLRNEKGPAAASKMAGPFVLTAQNQD
jgi:CHAT domain-containing protein